MTLPIPRKGWRFTYPFTPDEPSRYSDGDTLHGLIEHRPGAFQLVKFRLAIIDAPELDGPTQWERDAAVRARIALWAWLGNHPDPVVVDEGVDKYGRPLGSFYDPTLPITDPERTLNSWLCQQGLAVPYRGKTGDLTWIKVYPAPTPES